MTKAVAQSDRLIQAAMEYAGYGWRVLPLHTVPDGVCSCGRADCIENSRGKHPRINNWQNAATSEEAKIEQWWSKWPDANVGVVFGETSGLIDIECDSPQEEAEYCALFGGDPPITATFQSGRGKHRLFRWRDDLPGGATVKLGSIAVRTGNAAKGAYSVFPPSIHHGGKAYRWLVPPSECPPADIPKQVLARLWNLQGDTPLLDAPEGKSAEDWDKILGGSSKGHRNTDMAAYCGKMLRGQTDLSSTTLLKVLYQSVEAVNGRNQPPLTEKELRTIFTSILKREQTRRMSSDADAVMPQTPEKQVEAAQGKQNTGVFRLVIVDSDPPRYELHAPQFDKARNGCIILTAEQMNSPGAIRTQALKQAVYPLPKDFDKAWSKKDGLYERLVFNAEHRDAIADDKRSVVIVGQLLEQLNKARVVEEGRDPDPRGRPCMMHTGEVICKFGYVWEPLRRAEDKVERRELSIILQEVGVDYRTLRVAGKANKFLVLSPDCVKRLRSIGGLEE